MFYTIIPTILFVFTSLIPNNTTSSETKILKPIVYAKTIESNVEAKIESAYNNLHSAKIALPKLESFAVALKGYYSLKEKGLILITSTNFKIKFPEFISTADAKINLLIYILLYL